MEITDHCGRFSCAVTVLLGLSMLGLSVYDHSAWLLLTGSAVLTFGFVGVGLVGFGILPAFGHLAD